MNPNPYTLLAQRLDNLPNGFPPTGHGVELKLLARLFSPEEALLASQLRLNLETPDQIALRVGGDAKVLHHQLKGMARRGLITAGRVEGGIGFGLMPFVVGIYEMQVSSMDAELALLFEDYFRSAFGHTLAVQPSVHRVIPVGESVRVDMEIHPFESVADILAEAQAWGVMDCICRKQKALIGEACNHPVEVCMVFSHKPGAFDQNGTVRALNRAQAMDTLQTAAKAGLVHSVSNSQSGLSYICNCCTCSCGVLRGIAELGIADAVARSAFVNQVDEDLCLGCELCLDYCQFNALSIDTLVRVHEQRCVGCGVCVPACPEAALGLVRRPARETAEPPIDKRAWMQARAAERGIELGEIG